MFFITAKKNHKDVHNANISGFTVCNFIFQGQLIFGHPGSGGQVAFADPENKIGYSYITNFLSIFGNNDDPRFIDIQGIMYECADKYNSLKNV